MVTEVPTTPWVGDGIYVVGMTKNDCALLDAPLTVTTTSANPAAKLPGTGTTIFVSVQEVGAAMVAPKVTVLLPCVDPKPDPLTVTDPPTGLTGPTVGDRLVMWSVVWATIGSEKSSIRAI